MLCPQGSLVAKSVCRFTILVCFDLIIKWSLQRCGLPSSAAHFSFETWLLCTGQVTLQTQNLRYKILEKPSIFGEHQTRQFLWCWLPRSLAQAVGQEASLSAVSSEYLKRDVKKLDATPSSNSAKHYGQAHGIWVKLGVSAAAQFVSWIANVFLFRLFTYLLLSLK